MSMDKKKTIAIILMGGEGARFGEETPKQLYHLGGTPVFIHTLKKFLKIKDFCQIILPTPEKWIASTKRLVSSIEGSSIVQVIPGGKTRQESSYKALLACPKETSYVVIHDSVRPFISSSILQQNIKEVMLHGAVDTCIPSCDTLVHTKDRAFIDTIPNRNEFLRGQTPQSFAFPLILKAHEQALKEGTENSSDDCKLVLKLGHPIKVVEGSEYNIKITTKLDLFMAERLLYTPIKEENTVLQKTDLVGKTFAITGGTGDIGRALCEHLSSLGAKAVPIAKQKGEFTADLTNYKETKQLFQKIHAQYGPLDGVINSVGALTPKDLSSISEEEIQQMIKTNLLSVIYACKCSFIKKGGHIINISSSSYSRGRKEYPIYSATKAAVVNFTQALAEERPDLFVNVVVPQRTKSALRTKHFPNDDPALLLDPSEISNVISQLIQKSSFSGNIVEVRKN